MPVRAAAPAWAIGYARPVRAPALRILLSLLALPALACGDGHSAAGPPGPPPPAVEVLTLARQSFEEQADLLGELQAESSVQVRSEVPGIVETIDFQEGQAVTQGQVLFHLRDREAA